MWALVLIAYIQNIWGIRLLPMFELFSGMMHILVFLAIFVVMLVIGRNADAKFVFTTFVNESGWSNNGVAWFIGLLPSIYSIIGKAEIEHCSSR
jgi:choline transport protein